MDKKLYKITGLAFDYNDWRCPDLKIFRCAESEKEVKKFINWHGRKNKKYYRQLKIEIEKEGVKK